MHIQIPGTPVQEITSLFGQSIPLRSDLSDQVRTLRIIAVAHLTVSRAIGKRESKSDSTSKKLPVIRENGNL